MLTTSRFQRSWVHSHSTNIFFRWPFMIIRLNCSRAEARTQSRRSHIFRFRPGAVSAEFHLHCATFIVNLEPHTGARPLVCLCVGLTLLVNSEPRTGARPSIAWGTCEYFSDVLDSHSYIDLVFDATELPIGREYGFPRKSGILVPRPSPRPWPLDTCVCSVFPKSLIARAIDLIRRGHL
jgi:hypothetical protein